MLVPQHIGLWRNVSILRDPALPRPKHFMQLGLHNEAHLVAFRAATSVAIPLFVTPLSILMVELARHTDGTALLRDRALETALGAVVGIVLTVVAHQRAHGAPTR